MPTSVIVGGSTGLGRTIASRLAARGDDVVITSRDASRANEIARDLGPTVRGLAVNLAAPDSIAAALVDIESVDNLVITAIAQSVTTVKDFDTKAAIESITVKLVGYIETVRVLRDRFTPSASVVLFGGLAKDRPYPTSTMVTTFNAGVTGLVKTLAIELAPHRVNAIHPGLVGDSPKWLNADTSFAESRTPIGRLVTMDEIADATEFLLGNGGVNGVDLNIDGGVLLA
jgi:NAD(P)-dependent dehydrogenase (short-subunit alcohol dehydrogenase family)